MIMKLRMTLRNLLIFLTILILAMPLIAIVLLPSTPAGKAVSILVTVTLALFFPISALVYFNSKKEKRKTQLQKACEIMGYDWNLP